MLGVPGSVGLSLQNGTLAVMAVTAGAKTGTYAAFAGGDVARWWA